MSKPQHKFLRDMRDEMPAQGFLQDYLNFMRSENPRGSDNLEADIIEIFSSDMGLRVLKLFEKSVLHRALSNGAEESALREMNATRNFVLEIRRIVSHGASTSEAS